MNSITAYGFKKLSVHDKVIFDIYYERMNHNWASTLCFASMIAWNSSINIYHKIIGEYICCLAHDTTCDKWYIIPMIGYYDREPLESSVIILMDMMRALCLPIIFVSVSEWMLPYYKSLQCLKLQDCFNLQLSDYIYKTDDFWNSLNSQHNRYDYYYFIKQNNPGLIYMDSNYSDRYIDLLSKSFCFCHFCVNCVYGCQADTIRNITADFNKSGAKGISVYIDKELVGYAIVTLEKNQIIYHFKENLRQYRGLDVYLNRKCLELFGENAKTINYTEDMGLEGLKSYKQKLANYSLSHKYELYI